jgi:type II secretion system protein H
MRRHGFTLIELLVTIVIVAVLALVVAPSLVRMTANMRLQGAGNELLASLQFARSEAVSRNVPVQLVTQADGRGYRLVAQYAPQPAQTVKMVALPDGVTVTPNATVSFGPLRAMPDSAATLSIGLAGGAQLQLSAADTGQVQVCSVDGALSSYVRCPS